VPGCATVNEFCWLMKPSGVRLSKVGDDAGALTTSMAMLLHGENPEVPGTLQLSNCPPLG
jgi:hypothetical protein